MIRANDPRLTSTHPQIFTRLPRQWRLLLNQWTPPQCPRMRCPKYCLEPHLRSSKPTLPPPHLSFIPNPSPLYVTPTPISPLPPPRYHPLRSPPIPPPPTHTPSSFPLPTPYITHRYISPFQKKWTWNSNTLPYPLYHAPPPPISLYAKHLIAHYFINFSSNTAPDTAAKFQGMHTQTTTLRYSNQ